METTFKILVYADKVPAMASCTRCQRKFFTTRDSFRGDPVGAEEYLRDRFVRHECPKELRSIRS
jgi:hypothetical protein